MNIKTIALIFLILASKYAYACDCIKQTTTSQDFANSKFVIYGMVEKVEPDLSNTLYEGLLGNVRSLEIYKGSANSIKTVSGSAQNSAGLCMVKLEPGEYVLYSNNETTSVSSCSLSIKLSAITKEKKQLLLKSLRELREQKIPK